MKKYLPFLVILIFSSYLSFLIGSKIESKKAQQESTTLKNLFQATNPAKKETTTNNPSDKLIDPKKQIILSTNISQVLRGTLVSYSKDSWTIRYGADTLTAIQQVPNQKISYFVSSRKTKKTVPIKSEELKVGDYVNIITQYLPKEEKIAVTSVSAYRE